MIGELAALGAAMSWTVASVCYRKALLVASPFQANMIRFTSAGIVIVIVLSVTGQLKVLFSLPFSVSVIAIVSGMFGLVLGDNLYLFSLRSLGVARAVPICFSYPLLNVLIATYLKGERISVLVAFGAVSVVAGTWLVSRKENSNSNGSHDSEFRKGLIMAVSTAMIWSVSVTLLNSAVTLSTIDVGGVVAITALRILAAWIVLLVASPAFDRGFGFLKVPWRTWLLISTGSLVAIGLGHFLLSFSFLYTIEARAVPLSSTTPFFSVLAGTFLLHEPVTRRIISGSIIIVLGTFLLFI